MGRTKGALNKSTIAKRESAAKQVLDIDKNDNLVFGGAKVGVVKYVNDMFVATVDGTTQIRGFDLDEVLDEVRNTVVF